MKIKRYDIFLANLNPTLGSEIKKTRPVVVVSMDEMNECLDTLVVCPLTTKVHPLWKSRIQVKCSGRSAEIAVDQIRTISRLRLIKKVDVLSSSKAAELRALITEMYGQ